MRRIALVLGPLMLIACSPESVERPDAGPRRDAGRDAEAPLDANLVDVAIVVTPIPNYLLTVENSGVNNEVHRLLRIGVAPADYGMTREICPNIALPSTVDPSNIISSLTFNQGRLLATGKGTVNGDTMFEIDPCTCTATVIGAYGFDPVPGITSIDTAMFGVTTTMDLVITINPMTAVSARLGALPNDWGTAGLSWSGPVRNSLLGISGSDDTLVEFNATTGAVIGAPLTLDHDFGSVGMEFHPGLSRLFACSTEGNLLEVDATSGHVTVGPSIGPTCNNLAAPFGTVDCIL